MIEKKPWVPFCSFFSFLACNLLLSFVIVFQFLPNAIIVTTCFSSYAYRFAAIWSSFDASLYIVKRQPHHLKVEKP